MNKLKYVLLLPLLSTSLAYAATPCDGFEVRLKNQLADDLFIRRVQLDGADIQPSGLEKLKKHSEEVFTVNHSNEQIKMSGEFVLNTISLPTKEVKIKFNLSNKGVYCEHEEISPKGDLSLDKTRLPGEVQYTIGE